ncbi:RDD family protein [Corynebacterium lizhenjunii]|uniref:RDD family protein n=1 Tax=Corynebacterium lizhenjunii TaxID=2709394 RepID=A0A7T0P9G1_9CORY|nr:RDD family protein [Corynebacterium lizhenjunii]QPK78733.1 RDD family protein [Corynebacterium lizhenjunii]
MSAPDLYAFFRLDPKDNCTALGVQLSARDARLAGDGFSTSSQERKLVSIGYAVLANDANRQAYDEALQARRTPTWQELQYLGDFGTWPPEYAGWTEPDPEHRSHNPYADTAFPGVGRSDPNPGPTSASPFPNPANPYVQQPQGGQVSPANPIWGQPTGAVNYADLQQRASNGTRALLGLADLFIATSAAGVVAVPLTLDGSSLLAPIVYVAVMLAVVLVPEHYWGGSPAKLLFGYRVRDVDTKEQLSLGRTLQRNWFRLAIAVPAVGPLVSSLAAIHAYFSISADNDLRAPHDRLAGAEVVKKTRR